MNFDPTSIARAVAGTLATSIINPGDNDFASDSSKERINHKWATSKAFAKLGNVSVYPVAAPVSNADILSLDVAANELIRKASKSVASELASVTPMADGSSPNSEKLEAFEDKVKAFEDVIGHGLDSHSPHNAPSNSPVENASKKASSTACVVLARLMKGSAPPSVVFEGKALPVASPAFGAYRASADVAYTPTLFGPDTVRDPLPLVSEIFADSARDSGRSSQGSIPQDTGDEISYPSNGLLFLTATASGKHGSNDRHVLTLPRSSKTATGHRRTVGVNFKTAKDAAAAAFIGHANISGQMTLLVAKADGSGNWFVAHRSPPILVDTFLSTSTSAGQVVFDYTLRLGRNDTGVKIRTLTTFATQAGEVDTFVTSNIDVTGSYFLMGGSNVTTVKADTYDTFSDVGFTTYSALMGNVFTGSPFFLDFGSVVSIFNREVAPIVQFINRHYDKLIAAGYTDAELQVHSWLSTTGPMVSVKFATFAQRLFATMCSIEGGEALRAIAL